MENKLVNLKKRIMDYMHKVLELILVVMLIGLIVLMFTGKSGAFISAGAFSFLIIAANLPSKKGQKLVEESKSEEETKDSKDEKIWVA